MTSDLAKFIPWLPALGAALCGLCCIRKPLRLLAAPVAILSILGAFILSLLSIGGTADGGSITHAFNWIRIGGLVADMSYFVDPLTIVMLCVVTGIGTLVAIYAAGYMAGDRGYARFFAFVSLFIFAMTSLVLADNLVLLYLGWEGVGLCSYLLIGFYYQKPSAVAAAKKAFIVNRIGDLGFALGVFLIYATYGTVRLHSPDPNQPGVLDLACLTTQPGAADYLIPFLLMLGAFGKSAQLPLYVWLPDAMEGPTPVSALIHAATMVTAGVYMIARLLPVFVLSPYALPTVAVVGGLTAVFAATIALCQYDIKRIYAYSTISQLGYMFLGVGALSTIGGIFHLFTHAFFKALLFLTAGSVMHALAGQLDLRKMSGLIRKMPITGGLMFLGCLALAGFPFTAGFYSKDMILAATMEKGVGPQGQTLYLILGILGLFTALLTAFYTFRLWFRIFAGPLAYEMGEEAHRQEEEHGHGHDHAQPQAPTNDKSEIQIVHHHEPHEMSWLMNGPLVVLALGALGAGYFGEHWIEEMVQHSTAAVAAGGQTGKLFGYDLHLAMMCISSVLAIAGIILAAYFHWWNRPAADRIAQTYPNIVRTLANKYYVDEIYAALLVRPLRTLGSIFYVCDRLIIDGLVSLAGFVPRLLGLSVQPTQAGLLQGYGLGMATGVGIVVFLLLWIIR